MKKFLGLVSIFALSVFIGCGGGGGDSGGNSGSVAYPVDVTLLDGYIINATLSDSENTPVQYQNDKKVYHFYDTPSGTIKASGGTFESGLANKMTFSVSSNTKVITPIVAFLDSYPELKNDIAIALKVSPVYLTRDYIEDNQIQIAKFAQILYAMSIHNLTSQFAKEIEDVKTYEAIAYSAVKVSSGNSHEEAIRNFIYALDDKTDVKTLENDVLSQKKIMQENVSTGDTGGSSGGDGKVASVMSVKEVKPVGNLKLNVTFSEKIVVNTENEKNAFSLRQIIHSIVPLDNNANIEVSAKSLTLPLQNAISTDETTNTYIVKANNNFVSNEGLSLAKDSVQVNPSAKNLVLQKVIFVSSKTLKATFNLPIDTSTVNPGDFSINGRTVTYKPTSIVVDQNDAKTFIVTLGNTLTTNLGYDFVINSENLSATNGTSKLNDGKAQKEFTAKKVEESDLNEGFNILSANVDEDQKKITLNFSKSIMSNPEKSMFSVTLDALQEPIDLNISDNNGTSTTMDIKPSSVLISPEQNGTSYQLSIAKQSFFSVDGSRTLGSTYEKIFQIENYPKVTATLSGRVISITFNMSMDLNASGVRVTENGVDANITFGGGGANYTLLNSQDFNVSSTTLTINSGILSTDKKYELDTDFIKDFNSSN